MKHFQKVAQRIRVPMGFVLGALYLYLARPTPTLLAAGAAVGWIGVGLRAWASGHLRKNETVTASGPYVLTRNPLYLGSLLIGIGCGIAGGNVPIIILLTAFFLGIYLPVMRAEADYLSRTFPDQYPPYAARVPLLLPDLRALPRAFAVPFDARLYVRYREYRASLGLIAVLAVLAAKLYWPQ